MMTDQTKPETLSLLMSRQYDSPPEKVFQAWTDPEIVRQWWGNPGYRVTTIEIDLRVGGRYRWGLHHLETKKDHIVSGEYLEIVPNSKIVCTWQWESMDYANELILDFKPNENGCELTLNHVKFLDEALRDDHKKGWTGCFDRIGNILKK
jgi:uncharacterized protein YndB with AHSA1/START domain